MFVALFLCDLLAFTSGNIALSQAELAPPRATPNQATEPEISVVIKSVQKVSVGTGIDDSAYLVSYAYNASGHSRVYIEGLGVVPPKGQFRYLVKDMKLVFRDSDETKVLASVPLSETISVGAKPPLNRVPNEHEFELVPSKSFVWNSSKNLPESAFEVLNQRFNSDPTVTDKTTYVSTTFTELTLNKSLSDAGIVAQLALRISFPSNPAPGQFVFRVQPLIKEGRQGSDDLRDPTTKEVVAAADEFVLDLVSKIRGEKKP